MGDEGLISELNETSEEQISVLPLTFTFWWSLTRIQSTLNTSSALPLTNIQSAQPNLCCLLQCQSALKPHI